MAMSALKRKIKAVLLGKRAWNKSRDKRNHKKFI